MIRKTFPTAIKEAGRDTFAVTVSTSSPDRDGDVIDPEGWQLESYRQNPIVLWQHDNHLPPVARCTDIQVQGNRLVAKMEFPPAGISPLADEIHGLMAAGFLHSTSVGFRLLQSTPNGMGRNISEAELMEFSVVNIPSQIEARVMRCAGKACNEVALKSWLGNKQNMEDDMTGKYLEVSDDFFTKTGDDDPFQAMCDRMLAAYSEMDSEKFRELMRVQLATLGPNAPIDDLVRALAQQGVVASRSWTPEMYEIDEKELAVAISQVLASEVEKETRAAVASALNTALGRLD